MKKVVLSLLGLLVLFGSSYAQVEVVEEEVVEEVVEIKAAPEGVTAESVIQNYVNAIGGAKKMLKMKSITMYAHTTIQGTELMFTFHRMNPGKYYMEMGSADMTYQKQICDGEKAKIIAMGNETVLTGKDLETLKYEGEMNKELRYNELGVSYKLLGVVELDGKDAYYMEFIIPGGAVQYEYFDVESALRVRTISKISAAEGEFESVIVYSDYQAVKGVKFPFSIKQTIAGQEIDLIVSSIIPNKVDKAVFVIN